MGHSGGTHACPSTHIHGGAKMSDETQQRTPKRGRGRPRLDEQMVPLILDAAEKLIAVRGPGSVSVRDIASEAGIPHSAIYRYFETKDDIIRGVIDRGQRRQMERDERTRQEGSTIAGATDFFLGHSAGLIRAEIHSAMEGHTMSSLGIERTVPQRAIAAVESDYPFQPCTELDPRVALAASMALAFGLASSEDWIMDAAEIAPDQREWFRAQIDCLFGGIIYLGQQGHVATKKGRTKK